MMITSPASRPLALDGLTRGWNEWIAAVAEPIWGGVPTLMLLTVAVAVLGGVLWAYWPAWLPSHWPASRRERTRRSGRWRVRLRWRLRLRWRRRRRSAQPSVSEVLADDQVPDLPAAVFALNADDLAAAGRYAEAVRERLRAMVRGLIERDLLPASPGWTVTELARAGGHARPALAAPLDSAAAIFSEIWYGLRPATRDDDMAMREHAALVAAVAAAPVPGAVAGRST